MQKIFAILMILVGSTIHAQTMPEKVTVNTGRMAAITIQNDGDDTTWVVLGKDVDIFREYDPNPTIIRLRILSYVEGNYYIVAATTKDKKVKIQVCLLVVGEEPEPEQKNQVLKNLKAVYAADSDSNKSAQLEALIALYEQGTVFAKRPEVKTYSQLWKSFAEVAVTLGCHGKLKAVQQVIANEIAAAGIPSDGNQIIDKAKLIPVLTKMATLLRQVK